MVIATKQQEQAGAARRGATRKPVRAPRERQPWNFNWLNRLLILLAGGAVLAACVQAYVYLRAIPVEQVLVNGKLRHTQSSAVQKMVQSALVGGFLSADLGQVRSQLEALPWIYQASVRRRWPNTLKIDVVEQLPIARWGEGGFLNHEGQV
ncbi:MAG: cell division protein FtsQ/DivIB, partial [Parahaliea sp.]